MSLLCLMNPLAVAMAMLVLITAPRLVATLRNFWIFRSISLKRSGLPCFFSSNIFFGDSFVGCLTFIWYFDLNVCTDLKCFITAELPFTEAYFPISQRSFNENFLYDTSFTCFFFSSEEPSASFTSVSYSIMPRLVSLWRGICPK